jgi:ribonuclease G
MRREILIDSLCGQKRLAVVEDGVLCEIYIEREGSESLAGNIYAGHVENVLPGMNAAFVDIGLEKNAFLYAGDIQVDTRGEKELTDALSDLNIRDLVRPGQQILVQVVKESGGTKGPRVSSHITLAGRLIVLIPTMRYVGVSRKITDPDERARLRACAEGFLEKGCCGMIMRTVAEGAGEESLRAEYEALVEEWKSIQERGSTARAPALVHSDSDLVRRAVRDMLGEETFAVATDDEGLYAALIESAKLNAPSYLDRIRLHAGSLPLFDARGIDAEIAGALGSRVWLKSGGYLVIDYAEALTVIDVNTGKYVGKNSLSDTIFRTNSEAAIEIARQLRLRDIGGIVIVDFIDMDTQEQRDALLAAFREAIARDRTHTNVVDITSLGLVELTRKKARPPLHRLVKHACEVCDGTGLTDDYETVARRALYEMRRRHRAQPDQAFVVSVPRPVAGILISIGAQPSVVAHVVAADLPPGEIAIEALDKARLPEGAKRMPEHKE